MEKLKYFKTHFYSFWKSVNKNYNSKSGFKIQLYLKIIVIKDVY